MKIATVGYERSTLDSLIQRLEQAGVQVLIDVRAVAASRRPGFSKRMLAASLEARGVEYVHLRALGTPKAGRMAARAGRTAEMRAIYAQQLETPEAQAELARAEAIARERPAALLCYEADAAHCHRRIVAERMREDCGFEVVDL